jgi:hypothetical protein
LGNALEILVVVAVLDVLAHDFAHRRVEALALRHAPDCDIAVGDHPDETVIFAHR